MRQPIDKAKLEALLVALGEQAQGPGTIYLVGGATAVHKGWRLSSIDVDLKLDPEPRGVFDAIARLHQGAKMSWAAYPGGELLGPGLEAYAAGVVTDGSLLVSIVRPRLRAHGLALEERSAGLEAPHEKLYARVSARSGDGAHSAYNALIRQATSFCAAMDHDRSL